MSNALRRVSDFNIRVIMIFTTVLILGFFARQFPSQAVIFGFLSVVFLLSIITKGLIDIFSKEK